MSKPMLKHICYVIFVYIMLVHLFIYIYIYINKGSLVQYIDIMMLQEMEMKRGRH